MTYDIVVSDPTTVARIINAAHRFQCRASVVEAHSTEAGTQAHFEFVGNPTQLERLRGQIDRIIQFEKQFVS